MKNIGNFGHQLTKHSIFLEIATTALLREKLRPPTECENSIHEMSNCFKGHYRTGIVSGYSDL